MSVESTGILLDILTYPELELIVVQALMNFLSIVRISSSDGAGITKDLLNSVT